MKATDATNQWPRFVEETRVLDKLRKESFWDLFPEFKELQ